MPAFSFHVTLGDETLGIVSRNQTTRRWEVEVGGKLYGFLNPEDAGEALQMLAENSAPRV